MDTIDLLAYRCPTAMIMARSVIDAAINKGDKCITIKTIEPMCEKHIKALLNDRGCGSIASVSSIGITEAMSRFWLNHPIGFDEDDLEFATKQSIIIISLNSE